jgi:hypothetical protein
MSNEPGEDGLHGYECSIYKDTRVEAVCNNIILQPADILEDDEPPFDHNINTRAFVPTESRPTLELIAGENAMAVLTTRLPSIDMIGWLHIDP